MKREEGKRKADLRADDFHALYLAVERMKVQTQKQDAMIQGWIEMEAGRQSTIEARRMTLLTYVAFIFLSLTFVATLFSMNGRFALDAELRWLFWVVGVPITV